jgi:hypothetical protein
VQPEVAYFHSPSGLFRPVPAGGYWPLLIPFWQRWSLLKLKVVPFDLDQFGAPIDDFLIQNGTAPELPKICPVCRTTMQVDKIENGFIHQCKSCGLTITVAPLPKKRAG